MIEFIRKKPLHQIWGMGFSAVFVIILLIMIFNMFKASLISDKFSNMIAQGINVTDSLKDASGLMGALKSIAVLHTFIVIFIVAGVLSIAYVLYKKSTVNDMYRTVNSMGFLTFATALFTATVASGILSTPVFMIKQAFYVLEGNLSWEGIPELFDIGIRMHGDSIVRVALAFVLYFVSLVMAGFHIILAFIGKTEASALKEILDAISHHNIKQKNKEMREDG